MKTTAEKGGVTYGMKATTSGLLVTVMAEHTREYDCTLALSDVTAAGAKLKVTYTRRIPHAATAPYTLHRELESVGSSWTDDTVEVEVARVVKELAQVGAGATDSRIPSALHPFEVGDSVTINGETRTISSVPDANNFVVTPAFSDAPSEYDLIVGSEMSLGAKVKFSQIRVSQTSDITVLRGSHYTSAPDDKRRWDAIPGINIASHV